MTYRHSHSQEENACYAIKKKTATTKVHIKKKSHFCTNVESSDQKMIQKGRQPFPSGHFFQAALKSATSALLSLLHVGFRRLHSSPSQALHQPQKTLNDNISNTNSEKMLALVWTVRPKFSGNRAKVQHSPTVIL